MCSSFFFSFLLPTAAGTQVWVTRCRGTGHAWAGCGPGGTGWGPEPPHLKEHLHKIQAQGCPCNALEAVGVYCRPRLLLRPAVARQLVLRLVFFCSKTHVLLRFNVLETECE